MTPLYLERIFKSSRKFPPILDSSFWSCPRIAVPCWAQYNKHSQIALKHFLFSSIWSFAVHRDLQCYTSWIYWGLLRTQLMICEHLFFFVQSEFFWSLFPRLKTVFGVNLFWATKNFIFKHSARKTKCFINITVIF